MGWLSRRRAPSRRRRPSPARARSDGWGRGPGTSWPASDSSRGARACGRWPSFRSSSPPPAWAAGSSPRCTRCTGSSRPSFPGPDKIGPALGFALTLLVWIGTLISGLVLALAVAMLLSAPVLEQLSLKVDALVRGASIDRSKGWRWELTQSFRGTLFFLIAAPGVFVLSLVPVVGPPLALLWGAYALAFQQTDAALARRGLGFADRRAWHRYWNLESFGFGVTGLLTLIVPLANLLVIPALTVGGTLLVLELEDQLIPADVPSRPPR